MGKHSFPIYNVRMNPRRSLSTFPEVLQIRTESTFFQYVKRPGVFAVHGPLPNHLKSTVETVLDEGTITICQGEPIPSTDAPNSLRITPVYTLDPHGPLVVPTGQLFIRFTPDVKAEERRNMLDERGYTIVQIPGYAPHTAWIQATDGDIATSLVNLEQLRSLPGVVSIEPQLLGRRKNR